MDFFTRLGTKLTDFTKVSAEAARDGIDKIGEKSADFVSLNTVKMERKAIEKNIEDKLSKLGSKFYAMSSRKSKKAAAGLEKYTAEIRELKKALGHKDEEIRELYAQLSPESLEEEKINMLKEVLANGNATLEQLRIETKSPVVGKRLRNIKLPKEVLVGTVLRGEELIIPDGTFSLQTGDEITMVGKKEDVKKAIP